ncbi:hypothetical protein AVEN_258545-1 [Araneus ventricosus]|uniref:Paired domain-containing protein n=1 Tax=Araneus ventricosus TaxID=182803 RepID=A0A4Y2SU17_ARAVE|nr:hypothetical protein AVEN_238825-1 [Araneus ventricosus]GBN91443.1 hypothetical protein AVEN_258545-1 [Araneus ventricosus]
MARGRATDLAVRNQIIQQHQHSISQSQIGRTLRLTQSIVYSIIKHFNTTGNRCPGKAFNGKLTLTDREVRLFRRHIRKNGQTAVAYLVTWARQSFVKTISVASRIDISKGVATHSTKGDASHFSLHLTNVGVLHGPNLNSAGLHLSGKRYCRQMNPYLRFHMEILAERLLGRRRKQTIYPVTSAWFLKQALSWCGVAWQRMGLAICIFVRARSSLQTIYVFLM